MSGRHIQPSQFANFLAIHFGRVSGIQNNIAHCKVTARWAQANGEEERQNASLLKGPQIAQAESRD